MANKKVLITDIDNTLFDWFTMWHRSFSAMMNATADISGISLDELLDAAKVIHQTYGTSEYAFLLEELPPLLERYGSRARICQELRPAICAFRKARQEHMTPYPGVVDTLKKLKNSGHTVLAFSESKSYYSSYRIRELGLDGVVKTVYCPEDHALPADKTNTPLLGVTECYELPGEFKKPNPKILLGILKEVAHASNEVLYVGDSKSKDIRMAVDAGVDYLWFEFGAGHLLNRPEEYELLKRVSHWTKDEIEAERLLSQDSSSLIMAEDRIIQEYSDVLNHFI